MLDREAVFLDHPKKLRNLIGFRLSLPRLQAQRPRNLRVRVDMVAPANAPQFEPECFDKSAKFREPDILHVARGKSVP